MKRKEIQSMLESVGRPDIPFIMKKNGEIHFTSGYFYHGGRTSEAWARWCASILPKLDLIRDEDHFNHWPKDSYFSAVFRPKALDTETKV